MKKKWFTPLLLIPILGNAQVTFTNHPISGVPGSNYSMAVVDMNGDYLDDIVTVNSTNITIMVQQANGTFVAQSMNNPMVSNSPDWSLAVGDIDKNGFNDIVYGGGGGVSFMKANATGTAYTEVAFPEYVFSQRGNFIDINNDGNLDGYMCHDVGPNVYFLNDGSGNLTFHQGGIGDHSEGGNYGSVWIDYDNDHDMDCFIAKCRGGGSSASIDELHRNNGDGTFTNVAAAANLANGQHQAWSSAWNDYDNDGDLDVMVGESGWGGSNDGHKLMRNNGNGTFTDVTTGSGWETWSDVSIEHMSFDFDNDGFADVISGGTYIRFNNGDMTFTSTQPGIYGNMVGDLDNDGFLDVYGGSTAYLNNGNSNNWVKFNLKGIASNYNGIGARVEIYGDWGKQIRDVQSGTGFAYMSTLNVHFGIGTATEIDSVKVFWPSGQVDVIDNPSINQATTIVEGADPASLVEVNGQKLEIFPNPASEYLSVKNHQLLDIQQIEIISMCGEVVKTQSSGFEKISVSKLPEGAYVVLFHTPSGNYSESFVKKTE